MTLLDAFKNLLSGARDAIRNLRKAEAGIRERLAALDAEQAALLAAPPPHAEVETNLATLVTAMGKQWVTAHGLAIVQAASGRVRHGAGSEPPTEVQPPSLGEMFAGPLADPVTLARLAALFPSQLIAGLGRIVQATPYEPGPPMADRLARLAAIAEERRAVQARHAELVDEANGAGLTLEHLEDERGRRYYAAQRHKAWERDVAANREYYDRNPKAKPPEPPRPPEPAS